MRYAATCIIAAAITLISLELANYCADAGWPGWTLDQAADTAAVAVAVMALAGLLQVRAIRRELRNGRG